VSERLVCLQAGLVVPVAAVEAALAIERAGHRLRLDGPDLVVEPVGAVDHHDLEQLRRWKPHVRMLLAYTPSDHHLFDDTAPPPATGAIVTRRTS
jgi:hypothetical protein